MPLVVFLSLLFLNDASLFSWFIWISLLLFRSPLMADIGSNFGKTPSDISSDNKGSLQSTGDLLVGTLVQGNQLASIPDPNSMILKIKEMEAMLSH